MDTAKIIIICAASLFALIYLILLIRTGKPFKTMFFLAFLGLFICLILNLISPLTGVKIPINPASVTVISVFGVTGVIAMLIFPFVFI